MSDDLDDDAKAAADVEARELARKVEIDDLAVLLSFGAGRRFLWRVLSGARVFNQTYVEGSFDGTAFNEGRRSLGLWLYAEMLEAAPGHVSVMEKENR